MSDVRSSVTAMLIDCGSCTMAGLACDDCVVSVLLGPPGVGAVEIADEHAPALEVLAASGLVPPLRLVVDRPAASSNPQRDARRAV